MQKNSLLPTILLGFIGFSTVVHGLMVFGQSAIESRFEPGCAEPAVAGNKPTTSSDRLGRENATAELRFPRLNITLENVGHAHRLALPIALAGFMACMGPWLLIGWPTSDGALEPLKNAET